MPTNLVAITGAQRCVSGMPTPFNAKTAIFEQVCMQFCNIMHGMDALKALPSKLRYHIGLD